MKLYVMHRLLGNGGFDLFFLLQVSVFGYECVFSFYSEKVGKPNTNHDWHIPYPLSRREGYHTALQSIIISLSLMYRSAINLSLIDEMVFEHCSLYSQNTPLRNNFGSI